MPSGALPHNKRVAKPVATRSRLTSRRDEYASCGVDCGSVAAGNSASYRVILRNRSRGAVEVELDSQLPPWVAVAWESSSLHYGLPRIIKLTARFPGSAGEYNGELVVSARKGGRARGSDRQCPSTRTSPHQQLLSDWALRAPSLQRAPCCARSGRAPPQPCPPAAADQRLVNVGNAHV